MSHGSQRPIPCYALGCKVKKNAGYEVTLHRFPRDPVRCLEWVRFARNPRLNNRRLETLWKSTFLCQHHFTRDQYISFASRRLIPNAIPSLPPFIPSSSLPPSSPVSDSRLSSVSHSLSSSVFDLSAIPSTSAAAIATEELQSSSLATPLGAYPETESPVEVNVLESVSPQSPFQIHSTFGPVPSSDGKGDRPSKTQTIETSILRDAGLRFRDLTPRKKYLFTNFKNLSRRYAYLRKKRAANPLGGLAESLQLMVTSNLRNLKKKPKGRRWSREEKLFYCTLYKRSPQTYRYLRERMSAPAPQTLISVINSVPLKPGINQAIFEHLAFRAKDMAPLNKYCILIFDEMSIKPKLIYNSRFDIIDGFEDHGSRGRSGGVAREALVFMVRGLKSNWKQPIAYYFSKKNIPGEILRHIILEIISAVSNSGFKIVATLCDMGSNNVKALKLLGYSVDNPFFLFNGSEIFTMHDPPHLLKCTRNMFMKYPVRGRVTLGGEVIQGLGRWSHISEIYGSARAIEITTMSRHLIPVKPLTEEHLNPTWRQKLKVSLAAGVFSQNVVKAMEWYRVFGKLSLDSLVTTTFLGFFCNLFQSFNGGQSDDVREGFKGVICEGSGHLDLWESALNEIKTWDFIKEGRPMKPKSSDGWVITIKAAKQLWLKLKGAGFSYLEPQRLNQDPLENFFGSIRLHCGAARNPTVMQFASGFKTTLIKSVSANWTKRMNSFKDHDQLIAELDILLQRIPSSQEETENSIAEDFVREVSIVVEETAPLVSAESIMMDISLSECCSRILRMLLKNNTCSTCVSLLTADISVLPETLAPAGEPRSADGNILFPSEQFVDSVRQTLRLLQEFLKDNMVGSNISSRGKGVIFGIFSWLHCEAHEIKERTAQALVKYAILNFCRHFRDV